MIGLLARILAIPVRALAVLLAPVSGGRIVVVEREWTVLDDAEFARACRESREDGGGSCR